MSDAKEKANALVGDYKARLNPYVKAMKERGYFGEALKLQAQQDAKVNSENAQAKDTNGQANKQPAPQGQQLPGRQRFVGSQSEDRRQWPGR